MGATVKESAGDEDKLKQDALNASAFSINDLLIPCRNSCSSFSYTQK